MIKKLPRLDQYLSLWIFLAMLSGIGLGVFFPSQTETLSQLNYGSTSIPLALGLILMMYPPLAKVRYERLPEILNSKRALLVSLSMSWIVGPFLMFGLAQLFLANNPDYKTGLILVGLAPCIAMVLVWNDLGDGDREFCAGLVALNAILQILFFPVYAWFFMMKLPQFLGLQTLEITVSPLDIAKSVSFYLGIPLLAGFFSRKLILAKKGTVWFESVFLPKVSPLTLIFLLFTIVVMFSLKGEQVVKLPFDVLRIAAPLSIFFIFMFVATFVLSKFIQLKYSKAVTASFTASSNNFELAIAVAISTFGIHHGVSFATVIGPLVEVPVLLSLVHLSKWIRGKYFFQTEFR